MRPPRVEITATVTVGAYAPPVQSIVNGKRPQMAQCYRRALLADPTLVGKLEVALVVDASGQPSPASIAPTALPAELARCIATVCERALFPPPPDGAASLRIAVDLDGP